MLFETENIKAMGVGDIDLGTEVLNMEFETQPRKGIGITPDMFITPFVKLTGTLASPSLSLNQKGILTEGAVHRLAGQKNRCNETLAEIDGYPPSDK